MSFPPKGVPRKSIGRLTAESIGLWRASPRVLCLASASLVARRGSRRRQKRGRVEKSVYNDVANPDFSTLFASLTTVEMTPFLQSKLRIKSHFRYQRQSGKIQSPDYDSMLRKRQFWGFFLSGKSCWANGQNNLFYTNIPNKQP